MLTSILRDPMFDGVGPLIHKILYKGWTTSQQNNVSYEDFFQDFVVLWLKRRGKYDPSRGKMTTFAGTVALNFVRHKIKQAKHPKHYVYQAWGQNGESDFDTARHTVDFTAEEMALITAYENQESKKAIGLAKRLCEATQTDKNKLMDTMESIQHKVALRSRKAIVVLA